jgi:hypothetical protein
MKRRFILLIVLFLLCTVPVSAACPKFKLNIVQLDNMKGVNYSINYPVSIDYDGDSDMDILIMSKEGTLYFLENLSIP